MTAAHTPTPWFFDPDSGEICCDDRTAENVTPEIASINYANTLTETALADGDFIVRAANCHDALVAVARMVVDAVDGASTCERDHPQAALADTLRAAWAVLAAVEAEDRKA